MAIEIAYIFISLLALPPLVSALSLNYYDKTCPHAESVVSKTVKNAAMNDRTLLAALLRMHFHDCFLRVSERVRSLSVSNYDMY